MAFRDYRNHGVVAADPAEPIASRLAARCIGSGYGIALVETEWRRSEHPARSDGVTPYAAIEFMRRGAFVKRVRRSIFVDTGIAVTFQPGEHFEVTHPVGTENAGLTLRFEPVAIDALAPTRGRVVLRPFLPTPPALHFRLESVAARLTRDTDIAAEESLVELAGDVLSRATGEAAVAAEPSRSDRDRADAVREFLNARLASKVSLAQAAEAAGCSPWHVSKTFRRVTGTTIHVWLVRLRLRHALDALRLGERDLTALALRVGFSSHSHFTAAFRREYGLTPRQARLLETLAGRNAYPRPRFATLPRFGPDGDKP